jgi:hypothetical protein
MLIPLLAPLLLLLSPRRRHFARPGKALSASAPAGSPRPLAPGGGAGHLPWAGAWRLRRATRRRGSATRRAVVARRNHIGGGGGVRWRLSSSADLVSCGAARWRRPVDPYGVLSTVVADQTSSVPPCASARSGDGWWRWRSCRRGSGAVPSPPLKVIGMVSHMYKVLDGVFAWQNRVKTQGLDLWPEPVMVTSRTF